MVPGPHFENVEFSMMLVSETLVIIGSGKGLLLVQHQASYAVIV